MITLHGRNTHKGSPSWGKWVVIGSAAIFLATALVTGVYLTARTLALLFAAIVIAEALAPLIERMERRMPRGLAVSLVYLVLIALVVILLWFLTPNISDEANDIAARLPEFVEEVRSRFAG